jgi:hypothetical protein
VAEEEEAPVYRPGDPDPLREGLLEQYRRFAVPLAPQPGTAAVPLFPGQSRKSP